MARQPQAATNPRFLRLPCKKRGKSTEYYGTVAGHHNDSRRTLGSLLRVKKTRQTDTQQSGSRDSLRWIGVCLCVFVCAHRNKCFVSKHHTHIPPHSVPVQLKRSSTQLNPTQLNCRLFPLPPSPSSPSTHSPTDSLAGHTQTSP